MGSKFESLDDFIQDHVRQLLKPSGLPESDESLEALATAWLEKKAAFEDGVKSNDMEEVDFFSAEEAQGSLLMTYSGSLLNIGPLVDGSRHCEYVSIGLRADVPASAVEDHSVLEADFETDAVAVFRTGPVQKTSPILKIAHFKKKLPPQIEAAKLGEVTRIISQDFVEVNKTIIR